jgi:hypothetical protein
MTYGGSPNQAGRRTTQPGCIAGPLLARSRELDQGTTTIGRATTTGATSTGAAYVVP